MALRVYPRNEWMEKSKKSDILVRRSGERAKSYLLSPFRSIHFFLNLPFSPSYIVHSVTPQTVWFLTLFHWQIQILAHIILCLYSTYSRFPWKESAKRESNKNWIRESGLLFRFVWPKYTCFFLYFLREKSFILIFITSLREIEIRFFSVRISCF